MANKYTVINVNTGDKYNWNSKAKITIDDKSLLLNEG